MACGAVGKVIAIVLVAVLLLPLILPNIHGQSVVENADQPKVLVAMKHTKKITLMSVRNDGEVPLYSVSLSIADGEINFVKARGWDSDRKDAKTIMLKTDDKPIDPGKILVILLMMDHSNTDMWWTAGDNIRDEIEFGIVAERSEGQKQLLIPASKGSQWDCPPAKGTAKNEDINGDKIKDWRVYGPVKLDEKGRFQEIWCIDQVENSRNDEFAAKRVNITKTTWVWIATCVFAEGNNITWVQYLDKNMDNKGDDSDGDKLPDSSEYIIWVNIEDDSDGDGKRTDDDEDGKADILVFVYHFKTGKLVITHYEVDEKTYRKIVKKGVINNKHLGLAIAILHPEEIRKILDKPSDPQDVKKKAQSLAQGGDGLCVGEEISGDSKFIRRATEMILLFAS